MDLGISNRVALVAAASRGIGKAIALRLAREGARVAICARDHEELHKTAQEIQNTTKTEVLALVADVTRPDQIKSLIAQTLARFHQIDILVTNAGGPSIGKFFDFDDAAWESAFQLTFLSVVRLCREAIPQMQQRRWGRIINIASTTVKQPIENLILSNALRLAVVGLAKSLANELAPYGITVNTVCPGMIRTQRLEQLLHVSAQMQQISFDEVLKQRTAQIPLGRLGTPEELADLVAFLASENARYLTGTVIQVDGGLVKGIF
ncbi:MAG: SDR family oxidoreductase [Candidatus Bipolaricaulota bacterium]|nr:SDR family oxidoreductase [Candidatus Bipolaricaulota bacterium]MCS7274978.1 SDR family oxidoreductase [Candidatus Bipolaricaulota bacterium]MDW8110353.1 SDR family oxidoreductase [Candidatus Bipolaricaulota bacterium]MDW8328751.1 SDR family oxidoreductase [Candidatus Bipolaricaulota bacterium]